MKLLKDILYEVRIVSMEGNTNIAIENIQFDSRKVRKDSLFVATKGTAVDGHTFIEGATDKGAIAVVCETFPEEINPNVTYVKVNDSKEALALMAANFYDHPSEELQLVGVTGTNGKTTTVTLLHKLVRGLGYKAGLVSTVVNKIVDEEVPATHTTPDPIQLNELLREMVSTGCDYCFMEVSSHAVDQKRVFGLNFKGAVFTNITHDHLDYHKTFDNYIKAKKAFFDGLSRDSFALINIDDKNAGVMVQNTKAKVRSIAVKKLADYHAKVMENTFDGLVLNINGQDVWTKMMGDFNAYNLLSVFAVADQLGMDNMQVLTMISTLKSVDGRFQYLQSEDKITAIVDYAHTPDALKNVLKTINNIRTGNEQLITVVGCGGDRDKTKRPIMARIAADLSDRVVLTSDNPRTEDPEAILKEMEDGLDPIERKKTIKITNREEGIKTACALAQAGDIILIAGKGHEKYQEINGERGHFDDVEIVEQNLKIISK